MESSLLARIEELERCQALDRRLLSEARSVLVHVTTGSPCSESLEMLKDLRDKIHDHECYR